MGKLKKRHWIIIAICVLLLIGISVTIFFYQRSRGKPSDVTTDGLGGYDPYNPPEGIEFVEIVNPEGMNVADDPDSYSHENDPEHPLVDVKTTIKISNQGIRPATPKPLDFSEKYSHLVNTPTFTPTPTPTPTPAPTPSVTLTPGNLFPEVTPGGEFPELNLPDLYIVNPNVLDPSFAGDEYELQWKYTGGRKPSFDVSFTSDGGKSFISLAKGLTAQSCLLTFPDTLSENCFLRVTAMVGIVEYATADSNKFGLVAPPDRVTPPETGNIDPQIQYVNMPGIRISDLSGLPVWFQAENTAENTDKLIWQLSRVRYLGTEEMFGQEAGIVATGEIDKLGGEFSIDLKALCEEMAKPDSERLPDYGFCPRKEMYEFYLRVVPLDSSGNCIGDPGRGIHFSYGMSQVVLDTTTVAFAEDPQIMMKVREKYYWDYQYQRISPNVLYPGLDAKEEFLFFCGMDGMHKEDYESAVSWVEDAIAEDSIKKEGIGSKIISQAVQVEIQVATSPFDDAGTVGSIPPKGLVCSYTDTEPYILENTQPVGSRYYSPSGHGIVYSDFAPSKEELAAMGGIYYYVRAIFYVPDDETPSLLHAFPSEMLTIAYTVDGKMKNEVKEITVESNMPYVQFYRYQTLFWEDSDYQEWYEITRYIEPEEMTFSIGNGEKYILAYPIFMNKYPTATRESYKALLDELIYPGQILHYVKAESGFWDEFFGLLKAIYDGVSEAYADAKSSVVNLVDYLPIGDTAKGYLKKAVTYVIDYGLASIGLPPSLPNLDQLAADGIDYLTKVAVEEALKAAGVPADSLAAQEITEEVREQVAEDLSSGLTDAILAQRQNPLNVTFLRLWSIRLYSPAYVDVYVHNYSKTKTTRSGCVWVRSGSGHDLFADASAPIPELQPGEHYTIRIYLEHLRNKYDGYGQYFDEKYYGKSDLPIMLHVGASFRLPDPIVAAKEQGIAPAPLPYVTEFVYDHPEYRYERAFIPSEPIFESDPAPNEKDFWDY